MYIQVIHYNEIYIKKEFLAYRKIAIMLTLLYALFYFLLCRINEKLAIDLFLGILLISLLQVPCIVN